MKGPKIDIYKYMVKAISNKKLADGMTWDDSEPMMYKTLKGARRHNFDNYKDGTTWAYEMSARLYELNMKTGDYDEIDRAYPIYFIRRLIEHGWYGKNMNITNSPGYEFLR